MRARELGITIGALAPGAQNAITDVGGVRVGHTTLIRGEDVRTGVTAIVPHEGRIWDEPIFAGCHRLNGNGELTGLEWIRESGVLSSPVGLTNTHSVGVVRDAFVAVEARARPGESFWRLPVVGETWDGVLNDVNGQHVTAEHAAGAVGGASDGPVPEGNVGGGTGMICHGFKGGIGTSSRVLPAEHGGFTVGVLVQANHGRRDRLRVDGAAVGAAIPDTDVPIPRPPAAAPPGAGSIIAIVATDAPLLPGQCARVAQRAGLGVARVGGLGEHFSGDIFLAFSTGSRGLPRNDLGAAGPVVHEVSMLSDLHISAVFEAVVDSTEEAILNALLAAETMTGREGVVAYALEPDRLERALAQPGVRA